GIWLFPYIIVKEHVHGPRGEVLHFESTFIPDWKRRGEIAYRTPPLRRGIYRFGDTVCSTEDIFGLFEHSGQIKLNDSFCVYPQTVRIKDWQRLVHMMRDAHHHSNTTRAYRETTQINGVREYVYGDRLSRIH